MDTTDYRVRIHAMPEQLYDNFSVYISRNSNGKRSVINPVTVTESEVKPGDHVSPSMMLDRHVCQQMMNELWQQGFRPLDGSSSLAHVEAMTRHLEDMRRLVFNPPSTGSVQS